LPPEPGVIFGSLLSGCIRDEYLKDDSKMATEGAIFLVLGVASSVATAYLLSMVGILL
jgi:hypothetical protein